MKTIFSVIAMLSILIGVNSCMIVEKHDNGNHNGWYKNPNNPHNPAHSTAKGNGKEKRKEK